MKIKKIFKCFAPVFLVVMMLCMMSVTAFAAEAVVPDGWTVLGNGEEFTANDQIQSGVSGRITQCIPVTEGVSYTFVPSDSYGNLARFCGITADNKVVQIGMCRDMDYTYTADGTYQWIAIASINSTRVTGKLTWTEPPSIFDDALAWVGFLGDAAGEVFDIFMSHPLSRLGFILILGSIAVFILRGFTPFI